MKNTNPFFALIILVGISGWCSFCTNTGKPDKPPVSENVFCSTVQEPEQPGAIAAKGKQWPVGQTIVVQFLDQNPTRTAHFKQAASEWMKYANIKFGYTETGPAQLRVGFQNNAGSWSTVGTATSSTGKNMNIGWDGTGVALHEIGHFLSLLHEQSNWKTPLCFNRSVVDAALKGSPNFWSQAMIDFNVYRLESEATAIATDMDRVSVMMYRFPGSWMCDGKAISGSDTLSATDKAFASKLYPFPTVPPPTTITISRADAAKIIAQLDKVSLSADKANVDAKAALSLAKSLLK